jgi:hypothetical protein
MLLASGIAVVEASIVGLIVGMMAWGARREPLRTSLYHAVRLCLLQSPQLALGSCVLFGCAVFIYNNDPFLRALLPVLSGNADAWVAAIGMILGAWAFWGMLRAVAAPRPQSLPATGPDCQNCGYSLRAAAPDGHCPECGEPVTASVGWGARPGVAWEQDRPGWPGAWWRTQKRAIFESRRFGREMRVWTSRSHGSFLGVSAAAGGLICLAGMVCLNVVAEPDAVIGPSDYPLVLLVAGCSGAAGTWAVALVAASLLGTLLSWQSGRNLLPAAMRASAYLSGVPVFVAAYNWLGLCLTQWLSTQPFGLRVIRFPFLSDPGIGLDLLVGAVWFVANLAWLWLYARLLQRIVLAARFAQD